MEVQDSRFIRISNGGETEIKVAGEVRNKPWSVKGIEKYFGLRAGFTYPNTSMAYSLISLVNRYVRIVWMSVREVI